MCVCVLMLIEIIHFLSKRDRLPPQTYDTSRPRVRRFFSCYPHISTRILCTFGANAGLAGTNAFAGRATPGMYQQVCISNTRMHIEQSLHPETTLAFGLCLRLSSELRRQFDAFCNGQHSKAISKESGSEVFHFFTTLDFFEWTNAHSVSVKCERHNQPMLAT